MFARPLIDMITPAAAVGDTAQTDSVESPKKERDGAGIQQGVSAGGFSRGGITSPVRNSRWARGREGPGIQAGP